jgi:hypothetical protein
MLDQVAITSYEITNPNHQVTSITSVSLPDGRTPPQGLFTANYGAQDTVTAVIEARQRSRALGKIVQRVDMKVNAGSNAVERVNAQSAQQAVFLNLERVEPSFEQHLITQAFPDSIGSSLAEIIDSTPDRLHDLFNCPDLPSLNIIVWPANHKNGGKLKVASVRDTSQISIVGQFSNANLTIRT